MYQHTVLYSSRANIELTGDGAYMELTGDGAYMEPIDNAYKCRCIDRNTIIFAM